MGSRKMRIPTLVGLILLAFLSIGAARASGTNYVKALIRFQPPSRNPKVEITSQSVPQE
jgi:hypothetical protein